MNVKAVFNYAQDKSAILKLLRQYTSSVGAAYVKIVLSIKFLLRAYPKIN